MTDASHKFAIVGAACRLPGAVDSLDSYWSLLMDGRDVITGIAESEWETRRFLHPDLSVPGRAVTVAAGRLDHHYAFDASFFNITPREASRMDPQQTLALELTWEAMEDAGIVPSRLKGAEVGVFIGAASQDVAFARADDLCMFDAFSMVGCNLSIISNRISHFFDLTGPSMTIDTACSSSLVALHQACISMIHRRIPYCLVGGVNVIASPLPFIGFSKAGMLAPDGRCRSFDADGKGYVRSEGGGVVLIRPLKDALADGDRIHAVIAASGVNTNGRTLGIALPDQAAQARLLKDVYRSAKLSPARVAFLEAHGTGTPAGDPIEAAAIGEALPPSERDTLWMGSVKSNIGHLETASGMAGLLKAMLVLKNRVIPRNLHFDTPNPKIDFEALRLAVPTESVPLPERDGPALAGVNSFGFGGSNAHVVLEEVPAPRTRKIARAAGKKAGTDRRASEIMALSARSPESLAGLAGSYADWLDENPGVSPTEATAGVLARRELLPHRLVVSAATRTDCVSALRTYAEKGEAAGAVAGEASEGTAKTAFMYSGNGGVWPGMGRDLMERDPVFAEAVGGVDKLIAPMQGWSVADALRNPPTVEELTDAEKAQPLLFAMQVGLTASLEARGVRPDAIFGHSIGEVAAAWAAGVLDLETAVVITHCRCRLPSRVKGKGTMAALGASEEEARELIAQVDPELEVAAVNTPHQVTLVGAEASLRKVKEIVRKKRRLFVMLPLPYPFHSARLLTPFRDLFFSSLPAFTPKKAAIPLYSTVTGLPADGESMDAEYWFNNVVRPVRFLDAVKLALDAGVKLFMEIGPHKTLDIYIRDTARSFAVKAQALPTLVKDHAPADSLEKAWKAAWNAGWPLDWSKALPEPSALPDLPTYAWNREDHSVAPTAESPGVVYGRTVHPLLGVAKSRVAWENQLDGATVPWLNDHRVGDKLVFPAAGFVEMALAASRRHMGQAVCGVENLRLLRPMILDGDGLTVTGARMTAEDNGFVVESRKLLSKDRPVIHAEARLLADARLPEPPSRAVWLADPERFGPVRWDAGRIYRTAEDTELRYGPAFRVLDALWVNGERVLGRYAEGAGSAFGDEFVLPPPLLDGAFQSLLPLMKRESDGDTILPYWIGRLTVYPGKERPVYSLATMRRSSDYSARADIELLWADGSVAVRAEDCYFAVTRSFAAEPPQRFVSRLLREPEAAAAPMDPAKEAGAVVDAVKGAAPTADGKVMDVVRAAAYAALSRSLPPSGASLDELVIRGRLTREGIPYAAFLLELLEDAGLAERRGAAWRLRPARSGATFPPLFQALLAARPEAVSAARLLTLAVSMLDRVFSGETAMEPEIAKIAEEVSALMAQLPALRVGDEALAREAKRLARNLPEGRRLKVMALANNPVAFAEGLRVELRGLPVDVTLLADRADALEDAQAAFKDEPNWCFKAYSRDAGVTDAEAADVLLVSRCLFGLGRTTAEIKTLAGVLAPGGLLLAAERMPSAFYDLLEGSNPSWWAMSETPEEPVSLLREPGEWAELLEAGGFASPVSASVPRKGSDLQVLAARKPMATAKESVRKKAAKPSTWMVAADAKATPAAAGVLHALENGWNGHGRTVRIVASGGKNGFCPDSPDAWAEALTAHGKDVAGPLNVLFAIGFDTDRDAKDPCALQEKRLIAATALSQGWTKAGKPPVRVWLLSGGAFPMTGDGGYPVPSQAGLWGFGRSMVNELSGLDVRQIDIQAETPTPEDIAALTRYTESVLRGSKEVEAVAAGGVLYFPRVMPMAAASAVRAEAAAEANAVLMPPDSHNLRDLAWKAAEPLQPGPGEVLVRMKAVGLNYRDVLWASGALPEQALENGYSGPTLGLEGVGEVAAVGTGVADLAVGDRVMCIAPQCFAAYAVTRREMAVKLPDSLSYEQAATMPVVFSTAWYAINHLARMRSGESILIHGAAGGVGLAAIQVARHLGLKVFATAGTPEKRAFLRSLGVMRVMDSRTLGFEREIKEATGGRGVDAVLNAIAGEAAARSVACLAPMGRFLELGKRDFYQNASLRLYPFRNNLSYFGVDLDQLVVLDFERGGLMLREVAELAAKGVFTPLPYAAYHSGQVAAAFQAMKKSGHIGKIVVAVDDAADRARSATVGKDGLPVRADATYLVTGGTRGFGLETARYLFKRGARHLLLLSRGEATDEAGAFAEKCRASGGEAVFVRADAGDAAALAKALDKALEGRPPLAGVMHAAAVFQDATVAKLTPEAIRAVMRPKAGGAWNLHRYTLDRGAKLDFFVLFSSATTLFGNPGQANYVAANWALEALAAYRRRLGLPALAVAWGAVEDVGVMTRRPELKSTLAKAIGNAAGRTKEYLGALPGLLCSGEAAVAVTRMAAGRMRMLPLAGTPLFSRMALAAAGGEDLVDLHGMLAGLQPERALEAITKFVTERVSSITRIAVGKLQPGAQLINLGMDSLSVVEMYGDLEKAVGYALPAGLISETTTIQGIAERLFVEVYAKRSDERSSRDEQRMLQYLAKRHGVAVRDDAGEEGEGSGE